jgi:hypothetical protein
MSLLKSAFGGNSDLPSRYPRPTRAQDAEATLDTRLGALQVYPAQSTLGSVDACQLAPSGSGVARRPNDMPGRSIYIDPLCRTPPQQQPGCRCWTATSPRPALSQIRVRVTGSPSRVLVPSRVSSLSPVTVRRRATSRPMLLTLSVPWSQWIICPDWGSTKPCLSRPSQPRGV